MSRRNAADNRLHLLILVRSFGFPNGMAAANRIGLLSRALVEEGVDVRVLCLRASEDPGHALNVRASGARDGVPYRYAPGTTIRSASFVTRRWYEVKGYSSAIIELLRLQRSHELSCVLFADNIRRWYPSQWLLRRYLGLLGVPVIVQLTEAPERIEWPLQALRPTFSHLSDVSGVIAISHWLRRWAEEESRRIRRAIAVTEVPIVVDTEEQPPSAYHANSHVLVYAASSDYVTDARYIMRVMRRVWERFPATRLAITGMDKERVRQVASIEGTEGELDDGRIVARGYLPREELFAQYRDATALLAPLRNDVFSQARFPTKIGEYLSSGRPVVTTDIGEIGRNLDDGVTAFISPAAEAPDYAAKICEVLENPGHAAAIGEAGRRMALERFDYRRFGPPLKGFLEEVCVGGRRPK